MVLGLRVEVEGSGLRLGIFVFSRCPEPYKNALVRAPIVLQCNNYIDNSSCHVDLQICSDFRKLGWTHGSRKPSLGTYGIQSINPAKGQDEFFDLQALNRGKMKPKP